MNEKTTPSLTTTNGPVPLPAHLAWGTGSTRLTSQTTVVAEAGLYPAAAWWCGVLRAASGLPLPLFDAAAEAAIKPGETALTSANTVIFCHDAALPPNGYHLRIGPAGATQPEGGQPVIEAVCADLAGAFAAAQTLRQLAGPSAFRQAPQLGAPCTVTMPSAVVDDAPAQAWRGVHLDVARHFMPKSDVMRFIELAAAHHLDIVHLHLTDDQGWRFQSLRHPKLTQVGAWRTSSAQGWLTTNPTGLPHGGFYTQDDLREIVGFARARGVMVVPEIELPGHVEAALAAYPELGTRHQVLAVRTTWGISEDVLDPGPEALAFFRDILDEICDVFDSPFIHIGGDEVPITLWRDNPAIQACAQELGLTSPDGSPDVARLHGWFMGQLVDYLHSLGRRAVVWDEALGPDLPPEAVVMIWHGARFTAQALATGHDVVLAPYRYLYFDYRQGDGPDEPVPIGPVRTVADVLSYQLLPDGFSGLPGAPAPESLVVLAGGAEQLPLTPPTAGSPGRILGSQAEIWTEYLETPRRVDFAAYPRLCAFSETAWRGTMEDRAVGSPYSQAFLERLAAAHLPRLDAAGVEYRPLDGPLPWQTKPGLPGNIMKATEDDDLS